MLEGLIVITISTAVVLCVFYFLDLRDDLSVVKDDRDYWRGVAEDIGRRLTEVREEHELQVKELQSRLKSVADSIGATLPVSDYFGDE